MDWSAWHDQYDDADSPVSRRLAIIQGGITSWLDATAPRPVRILSICAGDGRDVIQVLGDRPDHDRAVATLIETDPGNVARARHEVDRRGLGQVTVLQADAGRIASYLGAVPADLVMIAGVFGNIDEREIRSIIRTLPEMCAENALVIWTRRRRPPGIIGIIKSWFASEGFETVPLDGADPTIPFVGAHRFTGTPRPLGNDRTFFAFLPDRAGRAPRG